MVISMRNIGKEFHGKKILNNLSIEIEPEKLTIIYGKSGSGKTTLLNIIGLIDEFDRGDFYLNGKRAPKVYTKEALLVRRKQISYLFQNYALIEDLSIAENLDVGLFYNKESKRKKEYLKKAALEQVDISYPLNQKIYQLSGGEKQRVALARSFLKESSIILADEPTGSLDEENRNLIFDLLKNVTRKGKTVVMVSHDPYLIKRADIKLDIEKLKF